MVKNALSRVVKPIFVSVYKLVLPTEEELKNSEKFSIAKEYYLKNK